MSDRRFSLLSENLRVQMNESTGDAETDSDHLVVAESCAIEMVVERAELVVVGDEPELGAGVARGHVGSNVAQDVFVAEQDRAVDFRFSLPGLFVAAEEDFDRDILAVPDSAPDFSVASSTDAVGEGDLSCQSSLDQQRETTARARSHRLIEIFLKDTRLKLYYL